jgi:histidine phosphotransfer protein HptB
MSSPRKPSPRMVSEFAADPEMAELVQLFISELPARVAALNQAWTTRQINDLKRLSHQLKGASAGYGFPALGQAAATLETQLKRLDAATPAVEALAGQFQELIDLCSRVCTKG